MKPASKDVVLVVAIAPRSGNYDWPDKDYTSPEIYRDGCYFHPIGKGYPDAVAHRIGFKQRDARKAARTGCSPCIR